jgi:hypothetical protein
MTAKEKMDALKDKTALYTWFKTGIYLFKEIEKAYKEIDRLNDELANRTANDIFDDCI